MKKYISSATKSKLTVDLVKCYDIIIRDEEGNEIVSDYCYGNKDEAMKMAKNLIEEAQVNQNTIYFNEAFEDE